jgi:hypothetical protein
VAQVGTRFRARLEPRPALRLNFDESIGLWLDAIARGEYAEAARLMDWRVAAKAALEAR